MTKKPKKEKNIAIKEFKTVVFLDTTYLYALGDDGIIYFVQHDPKSNSTVWQQMPTPNHKTN